MAGQKNMSVIGFSVRMFTIPNTFHLRRFVGRSVVYFLFVFMTDSERILFFLLRWIGCLALLRKIFAVDPHNRITMVEILANPWFMQGLQESYSNQHTALRITDSDVQSSIKDVEEENRVTNIKV